jgi:hypothetical protein
MTQEDVKEMIRTRTNWLGDHVKEAAGENVKEVISNDDSGSSEESSDKDEKPS